MVYCVVLSECYVSEGGRYIWMYMCVSYLEDDELDGEPLERDLDLGEEKALCAGCAFD